MEICVMNEKLESFKKKHDMGASLPTKRKENNWCKMDI